MLPTPQRPQESKGSGKPKLLKSKLPTDRGYVLEGKHMELAGGPGVRLEPSHTADTSPLKQMLNPNARTNVI